MTASSEDERVAIYRALLDRQSKEDQGIRDACSALRLVTAVLAETSDEWETIRLYLSMEST